MSMNKEMIRTALECEQDLRRDFVLHTPYYYANHEITATCKSCGHKDIKNASTFMYLGCTECNKTRSKVKIYLEGLGWRMVENKNNRNENRTLVVCERCNLKRIVNYKETLLNRQLGKCRCWELGIQNLVRKPNLTKEIEVQMKKGYYEL